MRVAAHRRPTYRPGVRHRSAKRAAPRCHPLGRGSAAAVPRFSGLTAPCWRVSACLLWAVWGVHVRHNAFLRILDSSLGTGLDPVVRALWGHAPAAPGLAPGGSPQPFVSPPVFRTLAPFGRSARTGGVSGTRGFRRVWGAAVLPHLSVSIHILSLLCSTTSDPTAPRVSGHKAPSASLFVQSLLLRCRWLELPA
jgi:hypothetical protein